MHRREEGEEENGWKNNLLRWDFSYKTVLRVGNREEWKIAGDKAFTLDSLLSLKERHTFKRLLNYVGYLHFPNISTVSN